MQAVYEAVHVCLAYRLSNKSQKLYEKLKEFENEFDKKGEIIIIPSFAYAYPFKEGFAKVITKDDNTCYINEEGRIIVNGDSLLYVYGFFDKMMVAKLKDGQFVHINNNGKAVKPCVQA